VYTGVSGPVMSQALLVLFTGLRRYRERFPEKAGRLRLHFIGTSYGLPGQQRPSVLPIAEQCGTADLVEEILPRTGFLNSIRLQRDAGTLLLLGSNDPDYSPSKVFQYYLAERPILGLVLHGSIMEALLDRLSCAFLVRFRETGPGDDTCDELARAFDRILDDRLMAGLPPRNEAFFRENFLADESARRQCALFESAASAS